MTEPPPYAPPPLPTLTGATSDPIAARNEWLVLLQLVTLHGEKPRFVPGKTLGSAFQSPFRTGTIRLSDGGIEIVGMARLLPPKWFAPVSTLSWVLSLLGNVLSPHISGTGLPYTVQFALSCSLLMFVPALLQKRLDKRRVVTKTVLGWESVRGLQVDAQLRFVTLVFSSVAVPQKPGAVRRGGGFAPSLALPHSEFVTLGKLEPPVIAGFVTTVEHFAPHVEREDAGLVNPVAHWLTIALMTVISVGVLVFLITVFYSVWRMQRQLNP